MIDGFTAREPGITFAGDNHQCLRLLLSYLADLAAIGMALSAPVSLGDTERLRLLLQAGADPRRYADDAPCLAVYAAVRAGCDRELVRLLLDHGADPDAADPDGRSLYRLATGQGNSELAALLRRYGARDDSTGIDWFLSTCLRADQRRSARQLAADPGLPGHLAEAEPHGATVAAFEHDGGTYEIDHLAVGSGGGWGEFAVYCDGEEVAEFAIAGPVRRPGSRPAGLPACADELVRLARQALSGWAGRDDPPCARPPGPLPVRLGPLPRALRPARPRSRRPPRRRLRLAARRAPASPVAGTASLS